jgi:hypothetical protein
VSTESEPSSDGSERQALDAALRPFLDDVCATLDPAFESELVVTFDGDLWLFSAYGGGASFPESPGEWDRAELIAAIATAIPDSPAFDGFLEPWPLCPEHRDHPLYPEVRARLAFWACRNGATLRIPIGLLASNTP